MDHAAETELTDEELEAVLHQAMLSTTGDRMADCYLATKCAEHLVDRLRQEGVAIVRRPE
jgi:hypothetical protein